MSQASFFPVQLMRTPAYLGKSSAEAFKHFLHVATFLHGDDTQVVLLIHPDQECLVIIVPSDRQHSVSF